MSLMHPSFDQSHLALVLRRCPHCHGFGATTRRAHPHLSVLGWFTAQGNRSPEHTIAPYGPPNLWMD